MGGLDRGVILAVGHPVDDEAQDAADHEQEHRERAGHAVVAALEVIVQEHDQGHRGAVRAALAVGQDLGHVEHLQAADDRGDQGIGQDRPDQRQGDAEKAVDTGAAVQLGGLEDLRADAHDRRHQHDGGVAEPHQEVHQAHQAAGAEGRAHKVDGLLGDPHGHQDRVDGAAVGEQGEKQHGERRRHDQVGQVDDHLEKLLAPDLQAYIGEPVGQQQGNDDLRDEADQPQQQGVARILEQVRLKKALVVFQPDEVGPDLLDARAVVLIKAVTDGVHQRDHGKDEKAQKEREDKNVSHFA